MATGDHLREDGQGNFFGRTSTEIESDGCVDAPEIVLCKAFLSQLFQSLFMSAPAAQCADISCLGAKSLCQGGDIEFHIVSESQDEGGLIELFSGQNFVGPFKNQSVSIGKT